MLTARTPDDVISLQLHCQQYQHQQVRDLAWACLSPSLFQNLPGSDTAIFPQRQAAALEADSLWFAALDRNPQPLLAELARSKSTRLGIYFENLLRFYWQEGPHRSHLQLLAHNLQVQLPDQGKIKGNTKGAFDFLLRMHEQFWHIESAVKFYLGVPDGSSGPSQWHQWLGPNCNDRLDIKLGHLRLHQLALSKAAQAQETLNRVAKGETDWQRGLCLKGYLFYPAGQGRNERVMAAPRASDPDHLRGDWWYMRDFLPQNPAQYWLILPRERWLSPARTNDIHEFYCAKNLRDILQYWVAERKRPQLLAAMRKEGDLWLETTRSFVVPDHWPWTDLPSRKT